mmetsp:Transcript_24428/g.62003  ORF Transcript_24428/g.62003 Transcript_24428/m.62003 type:complete len:146 (+) Transcript_24428:754-1191(+)
MGGDVFLDGNGTVVLDHYSKTNQDRPLVEQTILPMARALDAQRRAGTLSGPLAAKQPSSFTLAAMMFSAALCGGRMGRSGALGCSPRLGMVLGASLALGLPNAWSLLAAGSSTLVAFVKAGSTPKASWEVDKVEPPAKERQECKT